MIAEKETALLFKKYRTPEIPGVLINRGLLTEIQKRETTIENEKI